MIEVQRRTGCAAALRGMRERGDDLAARCSRASLARHLFDARAEIVLGSARFAIRSRLGAGAMGVVYEAERSGCSGTFALKVLHRSGAEHAYRVKREFRALARLGHPNLVVMHELFIERESCAFSMERVRGLDFFAYVRPGVRVRFERLRAVTAQLADGLHALHAQGLVHRDVKPSNVLVTADGRAVLLDCGVALEGPEHDLAGTPGFMAPEQELGRTEPASDLYALGVMLEQALEHHRSSELDAALRRERRFFRELSARLRERDPRARPLAHQVAAELRSAPARVRRARAPRPVRARPTAGRHERRAAAARPRSSPFLRAQLATDPRSRGWPFVGRSRELAQLLQIASRARSRPRVIHIEGPAGCGKTALLGELSRRLAAGPDAPLVLTARCCPREATGLRALDPLVDALSDALVAAKPDDLRAWRALVRAEALTLFPSLRRVPRWGRDVLRHSLPSPREAALACVRDLLRALCRRRPVVLALDGAEWLDSESLASVERLTHGPEAPPLLWLLASRPSGSAGVRELAAASASEGTPTVMSLPELPCADLQALSRALLPARDARAVQRLARSQGSSLALLCLHLWITPLGALAPSPLAALDSRLAVLPPLHRELLRLVSSRAEPTPLEALSQTNRADQADVECALHSLAAQRLTQWLPAAPRHAAPYSSQLGAIVRGLLTERAPHRQRRGFENMARPLALGSPRDPSPAASLTFRTLSREIPRS